MAKVKSVNSSSSFYVHNPSFPELKFGLEITEKCSSNYDFDISSLLSDNENLLKIQCSDNDNSGKKSDDKESRCSLKKAESSKFASLGALAENHLKNNSMLPELSFDCDFSLSDLLSNSDLSVSDNAKNIPCDSDNLSDLCLLTEDDNTSVKKTSGAKNDVSFDDLSDWMNSSVTQTSDPLLDLFNNFSLDDTEGKLDKISSVSFKIKTSDNDTDIQVYDSLDSIQGKSDNILNIDLVNILGDTSVDSSETTDSLDMIDSSESNGEKSESTTEISDDDFLPVIDLTFCVKKSSKNNFSFYGNSPETEDSGFDEPNSFSNKFSIPSKKQLFEKNIVISQSGTSNKNITNVKAKQSLFSRAISVKPKIDNLRKSKLKNVMDDLLKGSISLKHCIQVMNSQEDKSTIDLSNESIFVSSYLKLPYEM